MTAVQSAGPRGRWQRDADDALLARLRAGDERAFCALVERYEPPMLRVARTYVPTAAVAEEVVQETWLGVLTAIDRFEERSSLRTWLFRILTNRAKTRGERERRSVPASCLGGDEDQDGSSVDPDRFLGADHDRWPGHWASAPRDWRTLPEASLLTRELVGRVGEAIRALPPRQQQVIVLRDVGGWSPEEACAALGLSEGNQRVLLHRARSSVRAALEAELDG